MNNIKYFERVEALKIVISNINSLEFYIINMDIDSKLKYLVINLVEFGEVYQRSYTYHELDKRYYETDRHFIDIY